MAATNGTTQYQTLIRSIPFTPTTTESRGLFVPFLRAVGHLQLADHGFIHHPLQLGHLGADVVHVGEGDLEPGRGVGVREP